MTFPSLPAEAHARPLAQDPRPLQSGEGLHRCPGCPQGGSRRRLLWPRTNGRRPERGASVHPFRTAARSGTLSAPRTARGRRRMEWARDRHWPIEARPGTLRNRGRPRRRSRAHGQCRRCQCRRCRSRCILAAARLPSTKGRPAGPFPSNCSDRRAARRQGAAP